MRLFLAVDCNAQKKAFKRLQEALPVENTIFPSHFHLTLKFLGETSHEEHQEMQRKLSNILFAPFVLHFDHVGYFSHKAKRKVIWAGVQHKTRITLLQQAIDEQLAQLRKKQKKFLPHVTLARIKNNTTTSKHLMALSKPMKPFSVNVQELYLIQSTITPTGPIYKILQTIRAVE